MTGPWTAVRSGRGGGQDARGVGVVGQGLVRARARPTQADHAGVGGLARDQRVDRRAAATAARSGLTSASNIFDRSRSALDAFADGAIADLHAVTDQQATSKPNSIESHYQFQAGIWPRPSLISRVMQGDPDVLVALNDILTAELTGINQYFVHYRMLENWGYKRLAQQKREESIEEMKHADKVIARILYLDGVPNLQRLGPVRVGEEPIEMHKLDLTLEREAVARLNQAIVLCLDRKDAGTRELLEHVLVAEEESVDWLETQLNVVNDIGRERYLAEQLRSSS